MTIKHLLDIVLDLFDGGAAGGAGAGAGDGGSATGEANGSPAVAAQGKKTGDLSKVRYGKQDAGTPADGKASTTGTPATGENIKPDAAALEKEFDALINDRFKDIYTKRTQDMIDRRFAKSKAAEAENATFREIADLLNTKYGVTDDSDFSKLKTAIENDDDLYVRAAEEAGMSVEQYKAFDKLQRKTAAYEAAKANEQRAQQQRAQVNAWVQEADTLKQVYPEFDLKSALENQNFRSALNAGLPMQMIYEGINHTLLMGKAAQNAADETEKRVVDNIRAKGKRPAENGTNSNSAPVTVKDDVSKLTKADREEIARRVMNGDRTIHF